MKKIKTRNRKTILKKKSKRKKKIYIFIKEMRRRKEKIPERTIERKGVFNNCVFCCKKKYKMFLGKKKEERWMQKSCSLNDFCLFLGKKRRVNYKKKIREIQGDLSDLKW